MAPIPKDIASLPPPLRARYSELMMAKNASASKLPEIESRSEPHGFHQSAAIEAQSTASAILLCEQKFLPPRLHPLHVNDIETDGARRDTHLIPQEQNCHSNRSNSHEHSSSAEMGAADDFLRSLPPPLRTIHLEASKETYDTNSTNLLRDELSIVSLPDPAENLVLEAQPPVNCISPLSITSNLPDLSHLPPPLRPRLLKNTAQSYATGSPTMVERCAPRQVSSVLQTPDIITQPLSKRTILPSTTSLTKPTTKSAAWSALILALTGETAEADSSIDVRTKCHDAVTVGGLRSSRWANKHSIATPTVKSSQRFYKSPRNLCPQAENASVTSICMPPSVRPFTPVIKSAVPSPSTSPIPRSHRVEADLSSCNLATLSAPHNSEAFHQHKIQKPDHEISSPRCSTSDYANQTMARSPHMTIQSTWTCDEHTVSSRLKTFILQTNPTSHRSKHQIATTSIVILADIPPVTAGLLQEAIELDTVSPVSNNENIHTTHLPKANDLVIAEIPHVKIESTGSVKVDGLAPLQFLTTQDTEQHLEACPKEMEVKVNVHVRGDEKDYVKSKKRAAWPTKEEIKAHEEALKKAAETNPIPPPSVDMNSPTRLVDWNGDLLPAPVEWASRPSYQLEDWSDKMVQYVENCTYLAQTNDTFCSTAVIDMTSSKFTAGEEIAPAEWILDEVDHQSLQCFWRAYLHQEPEPVDLEDVDNILPFWKRYTHCPFVAHLDAGPANVEAVLAPSDLNEGDASEGETEAHRLWLKSTFQTSISGTQKTFRRLSISGHGKKKRRGHKKSGNPKEKAGKVEKSDHPMVPMYLRPLHLDVDARQILSIYNYYTQETFEVPALTGPDLETMILRLKHIADTDMPFVVAVKGFPPAKNQKHGHIDKVIGFAFAKNVPDLDRKPSCAVSMNCYVHSEYRKLNIAKNMLDQLMVFLDPCYHPMKYVSWEAGDSDKYKHGYEPKLGVECISATLYGAVDDTKRIQTLAKWLEKYGLKPQTEFEKASMKRDTQMFKIEFSTRCVEP